MLRDRLVAAALGLPMLFLLLWLNWHFRIHGSQDDLPLLAMVTIIAGASGWELSRIVRHRYPHASPWNGVYAALIIPFLVHAIKLAATPAGPVPVSSLALLIDSVGATLAVMLLFLGIWSDVEHRGAEGIRENVGVLFGGAYLGVTMSSLLLLQQTSFHEYGVALVFLAVFGLDTAAYFGGKTFGGPPLAPRISPKKTLTGAACGLSAAVLLTLAFQFVPALTHQPHLASQLIWWKLAWVGIGVGVFGQLGDLLESALKRWSGVKDSGSIIPGHGGFLDRFDSLFLAAPVCYLLLVKLLRLQ